MKLADKIKEVTEKWDMLKHPFYTAWTDGTLPKEKIQEYCKQYWGHVSAFPRFVSATHSNCDNIENRKLLLENINDEEGMGADFTDHPELWLRFSEGMGVDREAVKNVELNDGSKNLVDTFFNYAKSSYEEGLASLYSYEKQIPKVSHVKIEALKDHYNVDDERSIEFFAVHKKADVEHSRVCELQLNEVPEEKHEMVLHAAEKSAKAVWDFLSELN